ncbi:MAG: Gfo/Idh/MocA family oxidoreductase [Planctomycetes bacterium]|nr:Gfo/Idh/MocA family oxidoreductase [Planctomycetota bacterium]
MVRIGFIGYGGRISGVFSTLKRLYQDCEIAAIADPKLDAVKERLKNRLKTASAYQIDGATEGDLEGKIDQEVKKIEFYEDADRMLEQAELDAVMIGTRCSLHAKMGAKVAERKLPLFLEKPVATTMGDLKALHRAFEKSGTGDKVVVSFPLRLTRHVQIAKEVIGAGMIGTVEHVQAINNVPYGGDAYFMNWYRDWDETHGLWLQKATHDLDVVNYIYDQEPVRAAGMMSQRVLGPAGKRSVGFTMPMEQQCRDCAKQRECAESPFNRFYLRGEGEDVHIHEDAHCMFGDAIKNQDNGSCLVEYESGAQAVYTQNFFARRDARYRGATIFGYKGTIRFDWATNELTVVHHHTNRTERYDVSARGGHGGGDLELVDSFYRAIKEGEPSRSPLRAGVVSALLCMKVDESCRKGKFVDMSVSELDA